MSEPDGGGGTEDIAPAANADDDDENVIKLPLEGELKEDAMNEEEEEKEFEELINAAEGAEGETGEEPSKEDKEKKEGEEGEGEGEAKGEAEKVPGEGEEGEKPEGEEGEKPEGEEEIQEEEEEVPEEKEPSVVEEPSYEEVEEIDRDRYIAHYRELMDEKTTLTLKNLIFNKKCVDYFKRKKIALTPRDDIPDVEQVEKNYANLLLKFEERQKTLKEEKHVVENAVEKHEKTHSKKQNKFSEQFKEFQQMEKQCTKKLLSTSTGKLLANEIVEKYLEKQTKKLDELVNMRLEYIVTRNVLTKIEKNLKDVDKLDEGFLVKDYEKLQAANIAYMKKLEERDATLLHQKAICATFVEMLAHMKEEMSFEAKKVDDAREHMNASEEEFMQARREQTRSKWKLRRFKELIIEQHELMGLIVHPKLFADFKETRKKISQLETDLEVLTEELERSKMQKASRNKPSMFAKHCIPLEQYNKTKPKFHKSANLRS